VAQAIRDTVPRLPLILKIGLFPNREQAQALVEAVDGLANALSTTNSLTARVAGTSGELLFGGLKRGIGGAAIASRCLDELGMLGGVIARRGSGLRLSSVGGVSSVQDLRLRLDAGAHHVQIATAAMLDPLIGVRIRESWTAGATA
jgi:dihydroorotate dehydrogenase